MPNEKPRCCTDCRHVQIEGKKTLERMVALGFVGCARMEIWQFPSSGFARKCKMFEAAPAPATQPEGALF
jgi:hypothetical protein